MHTDAQRRHLFEELGDLFTPTSRDLLMELLPPIGWSDVARQSDITALRGEMGELKGELRGEMAELRGEMGELKGELRGEMAELRGEMAELRSEFRGEIAELRTEVHGLLPRLITANLASMIGVSGLVLAATQLG